LGVFSLSLKIIVLLPLGILYSLNSVLDEDLNFIKRLSESILMNNPRKNNRHPIEK